MAWNDYLNVYGLAGDPPQSQTVPLGISSTYAQGAVSAGYVAGEVTTSLKVGNAQNGDSAVYIDSQGIYAGSAVFDTAPFSVNLAGLGTFSGVIGTTFSTATTGQRVVIDGATNQIDFYDSNNNLAGSILGNLVPDGMSGFFDTLDLTSASTTGSAIRLLWSDGVNGLARVFLDGFGGNPNINLNAESSAGPTVSSAVTIEPTDITIASTGPINYLPNGIGGPPTITGSKGGNVALANLMTALDLLGLVVDATT